MFFLYWYAVLFDWLCEYATVASHVSIGWLILRHSNMRCSGLYKGSYKGVRFFTI